MKFEIQNPITDGRGVSTDADDFLPVNGVIDTECTAVGGDRFLADTCAAAGAVILCMTGQKRAGITGGIPLCDMLITKDLGADAFDGISEHECIVAWVGKVKHHLLAGILLGMSAVSTSPKTGSCRQRHDGVVVSNRKVCREHFELTVRVLPGARGAFGATAPGQFIQIGCRPPAGAMDMGTLNGDEFEITENTWPSLHQPEMKQRLALLRRPFSLSGRWDDEQGTCIQIVQRVVGTGTQWLSELNTGDPVDLIGPLGNTFTLPTDRKLALLVGGGVGLPPMFYLSQACAKAGWDAVGFVGAMTSDLLAVTWADGVMPDTDGKPVQSVQEFAKVNYPAVVTTDDGSMGLKGRITDGLVRYLDSLNDSQKQQAVLYTCGPHVMMHAVAKLAAQYGIPCQACLEQAMACGMGTCQSCIVKIEDDTNPHGKLVDGRNWRYKLACTDGPVFDSTVVIW